MHLKDFIAKYNGKHVDYDGYYGAQCVDLFRFYCKEVLGISQPKGVNGAKDFWNNFASDSVLSSNFTKIPNAPDFVPIPGDVWIWNGNYGKYGHVAITSYGTQTTSQFECFSQNDPTGSACVLKKYSYKYIYGVLRPKNQDNLVISNPENATGSASNEDEMETLEFLGCKTFGEAKSKLTEHLGIYGQYCDWGTNRGDGTGGHLGSERRQNEALKTQLANANVKVADLQERVDTLTAEGEQAQAQIETFEQTIISKNKRIEQLEQTVVNDPETATRLKQAQAEIEKLKSDIAYKDGKIEGLLEASEELQRFIDRLKALLG